MDVLSAKRLTIKVKITKQLVVSRDRSLRRFSSIFILMLGCTLGRAPTQAAFGQSPPGPTGLLSQGIAMVGVLTEDSTAKDTPVLPSPTFSLRSLLDADRLHQPWIWLMAGAGAIGLTGSLLYQWKKRARKIGSAIDQTPPILPDNPDEAIDSAALTESTPTDSADASEVSSENSPEVQNPIPLRRIGIVETLIQDLHSRDPAKRRQAIWELGQRGDSRAIQPLVDLTLDSDSAQRSLILAALSEIGVRTLKPMNRALAVSLQDESPEVRKNAIRDLTRVYDLMTQVAQLLNHASEDGDREVSETARWAIGKLDRIRTLSGRDFSALPASEPASEPPEGEFD